MPSVDISKGEASLSWSRPRRDGGAPIDNYRIEKREAGGYQWEPVNLTEKVKDTRYKVTGLAEETDYEFRILAENLAGLSQPSGVSKTAKYGEWFLERMQ